MEGPSPKFLRFGPTARLSFLYLRGASNLGRIGGQHLQEADHLGVFDADQPLAVFDRFLLVKQQKARIQYFAMLTLYLLYPFYILLYPFICLMLF